jgi:hypothetical protein
MKIVMKGGGPIWNGEKWEPSSVKGSNSYEYSKLEAKLFNDMKIKWAGPETGIIIELTDYLADDWSQYEKKRGFNKSLAEIMIADSTLEDLENFLNTITQSLRLRTEDQANIWHNYNQKEREIESEEEREREKDRILRGFDGHKKFFDKMLILAEYIVFNYQTTKVIKGEEIYAELNGLSDWNNALNNEIMDSLALDFSTKMKLSGGKMKMKKKKRSKKRNTRKKLSKKRL